MKQLGGYYLSEEELSRAGFKSIGKNVKIHSKASLYGLENMNIGNHVRIDDFSVIIATGELVLGNYVSIPNFCFLGAKYGISIEDFATLAPGVKIFSASDDYEGFCLAGVTVPPEMTGGLRASVSLGKHTLIGCGTIILPGCHIGEGCSVGALSLVKQDLKPWGIYAGIPAVRKKDRKKDLLSLETKVDQCLIQS